MLGFISTTITGLNMCCVVWDSLHHLNTIHPSLIGLTHHQFSGFLSLYLCVFIGKSIKFYKFNKIKLKENTMWTLCWQFHLGCSVNYALGWLCSVSSPVSWIVWIENSVKYFMKPFNPTNMLTAIMWRIHWMILCQLLYEMD